MKRPLCLLAILLSAAVCIYLEVFLSDIIGNMNAAPDGSYQTVIGRVQSKEVRRSYQGEFLPVIYIVPTEQINKHSKLIQCYLESGDEALPAIGEYIQVSGKVKTFSAPTNPGEFDSRLYYSTLKISYRLTGAKILKTGGEPNRYREALYKIRRFLESSLDRALSEQDSAIMKAMLLGDKAFMDEETKDMYKNNGIMHILAVSGLHISLIGMGLYEFLRKLGLNKVVTTLFPIAFMYSYGIMCGMGTSSFRAICMFALRLFAPVVGRTYDVLTGLSLAEILLLLDQPLYMHNSGFLFSFGAVIGMTLIRPALSFKAVLEGMGSGKMKFADDEISFAKEILIKLSDGLTSGVSVFLATLPVYASFYYTYPLHSILLNLAVIPLMGILMLLGIITMFLAIFGGAFGVIPGMFVHIILSLYRILGSSEGIIRGSTWYMGHSQKWQVLIYIALVAAFVWLSDKDNLPPLKMSVTRVLILVTAVFALTFHVKPDLEIDMVDVGQGDGIVISCGGRHMLIDGGSTSTKNVGKYRIIPFLKYKGIGRLDAVVMTHEDEDHVSGILDIMDDMEKGGIWIDRLFLPEVSTSSQGENYDLLEKRAGELGIPIAYINAGESFSLSGATFTCLNPERGMIAEEPNAYSTVLYMKYGEFTALFTGDVENEGLTNVKEALKSLWSGVGDEYPDSITLLKVAHHGSKYTTDKEFLDMTRPRISLISCGVGNSYGHPHEEVLQRLENIGTAVYRTDESGMVTVEVNGGKVTAYCPANF